MSLEEKHPDPGKFLVSDDYDDYDYDWRPPSPAPLPSIITPIPESKFHATRKYNKNSKHKRHTGKYYLGGRPFSPEWYLAGKIGRRVIKKEYDGLDFVPDKCSFIKFKRKK